MIGNKIRALLELKNKTVNDLCTVLNSLAPAIYRKLNKNTFKTEEIIKIAEMTNTTLAFVDNETGKTLIEFDSSDIENKE